MQFVTTAATTYWNGEHRKRRCRPSATLERAWLSSSKRVSHAADRNKEWIKNAYLDTVADFMQIKNEATVDEMATSVYFRRTRFLCAERYPATPTSTELSSAIVQLRAGAGLSARLS